MKKINLMMNNEFLALIIPYKTGVIFSNQCGGTMCAQVETEGILIPLPGTGPEQTDQDGIYDYWTREYDREAIQKMIEALDLEELIMPIPIDDTLIDSVHENELESWGEAWIPVKIQNFEFNTNHQSACSLEQFRGEKAYLTYQNSD